MRAKYVKKDIAVIIFLSICSLCLFFCWWVNWFGWSNGLVSSVGDILVRALAWLGLMGFNPDIGGHTAHINEFVYVANLLFALIFSGGLAYFTNKKTKRQRKISPLSVFVFLAGFMIYILTTFDFMFRLERFGYGFFVPPA